MIVLNVKNVSVDVKPRWVNSMGVEGMATENQRKTIPQKTLPHPSHHHISWLKWLSAWKRMGSKAMLALSPLFDRLPDRRHF